MNSIAQQARPKFMTHSEYRRPQFSRNFTGWTSAVATRSYQAHCSTLFRYA